MCLMEITFNDWLLGELKEREWSFAKLSRKSGISQAHISKVFSEQRNAGNEFCESIANALGYPPEFVFRKAGILPPAPEHTEQIAQLNYLFNKFSEVEKKDLLTYMRIKLMMVENNTRDSSR